MSAALCTLLAGFGLAAVILAVFTVAADPLLDALDRQRRNRGWDRSLAAHEDARRYLKENQQH